jgi:hypothetical protein
MKLIQKKSHFSNLFTQKLILGVKKKKLKISKNNLIKYNILRTLLLIKKIYDAYGTGSNFQ